MFVAVTPQGVIPVSVKGAQIPKFIQDRHGNKYAIIPQEEHQRRVQAQKDEVSFLFYPYSQTQELWWH